MMHIIINIAFVLCFSGLGFWLESINGKNGFWDEFLTPIPLGFSGCFIAGFLL